MGIPLDRPFKKLTKAQRDALFFGTGERRYKVTWKAKTGGGTFQVRYEGLVPRVMRRLGESKSERAQKEYGQYMGTAECGTCRGSRLRPESMLVWLSGKSIADVGAAMTVDEAHSFFEGLGSIERALPSASEVLKEVQNRLGFLSRVGLSYLSLDRPGPSLSGGESQRIRLASQVGSEAHWRHLRPG